MRLKKTNNITLNGLDWKDLNRLSNQGKDFAIAIDDIIKHNFNSPLFTLSNIKSNIKESLVTYNISDITFKTGIDSDKNITKFSGSIIYSLEKKVKFFKFIIDLNKKTINYFE